MYLSRRRRSAWGTRAPVFRGVAGRGRRRAAPIRRLVAGSFLVVLMVAGAAGFAAYNDAQNARVKLEAAGATLEAVAHNAPTLQTAEGRAAATAQVSGALRRLSSVERELQGSIPLSIARRVPGLATQRKGLIDLIDDTSAAGRHAGALIARIDQLAPTIRAVDGVFPAGPARDLAAELSAVATALPPLGRSGAGLWGPIGDARRTFNRKASEASVRLAGSASALRVAADVVALPDTHRYFIALQNNAEMRDQGAVLQYAVARFDSGRLAFDGDGPISDLTLDRPAATPIPAGTAEVFGSLAPTQTWQSVNATADFAFAARAMADMFRQATGVVVDGVVAVDVPGLASLLRVVGPVEVERGGARVAVTPANAGEVLLHDLYDGLSNDGDSTGRKDRLSEATKGVIERLTRGSYDLLSLGRSMGDQAPAGHFRLWSANPTTEQDVVALGLGGGPADRAADRTFHIAVENRTATKLDYFVKPSVRQEVHLLGNGTAQVDTTVTIQNQAPAGQKPSYQLGPDVNTKNPGDYIAWVLLWAPAGSVQPGGVAESGLVVAQHITDVAAGGQATITFRTEIPGAVRDGRLAIRLVPQARLTPVDLRVSVRSSGGWRLKGELSYEGPWDRTLSLSWGASR